MKIKNYPFLILAILLCNNPLAYAHKIKLFATVENMTIQGYAYFAGGQTAKQATVAIHAADGKQLALLQTDKEGRFQYSVLQIADYSLSVNTQDGHTDHYRIKATEFSNYVEKMPSQTLANPTTTRLSPSEEFMLTPAQLTQIEKIISTQIRPLREQLEQYQDIIQFRDILGGIGYIVGLAGMWMFWHMRRKSKF